MYKFPDTFIEGMTVMAGIAWNHAAAPTYLLVTMFHLLALRVNRIKTEELLTLPNYRP
jgi:hypothetical protein